MPAYSPIILFSLVYAWQWTCIPLGHKACSEFAGRPTGKCIFALSGRIDSEHVTELESLLRAEGSGLPIIIDLKDVTLAGEDGIIFLAHCEAGNITLVNCPPYIRKWIAKQNDGS